jgi:BolA protein
MAVRDTIKLKLEKEFAPGRLEVVDESPKHQGHAGYGESGESHFGITIVSGRFAGKSRLERQRLVYAALKEELAGAIHAITYLKTYTDAEYGAILS